MVARRLEGEALGVRFAIVQGIDGRWCALDRGSMVRVSRFFETAAEVRQWLFDTQREPLRLRVI